MATPRIASNNTYTSLDEENQVAEIKAAVDAFKDAKADLWCTIKAWVTSQLKSYDLDTIHAGQITRDIYQDIDIGNMNFEDYDILNLVEQYKR